MSTLIRYKQTLSNFLTEPARVPDQYTRSDVEKYLYSFSHKRGYEGRPPSPGTIRCRLSVLNSFYTFASGYLIQGEDDTLQPIMTRISPTTGLRSPQQEQAYRTFSFEDFERLFSIIPTDSVRGLRDRAVLLLLFWTVRRKSEIRNLLWGDLYQSTVLESGVQRTLWMYTFTGKGHSRQKDHAELPGPAKLALDKYLIASGRMGNMTSDSPLFVACQGDKTRPLTGKTIWYIVKSYARKIGIDITVHSFRHMATQQRYLAGEDIRSLQRLLRHTSLQTTSIYLQGLMGTTDPAAKRLEEKFGKF